MWPFNDVQTKKSARRRRGGVRRFAGADFNRLVADWVSGNGSMDSELRSSIVALRNRSRDLGRNNDYVRNFLRDVQDNVIGAKGIQFQAQVKMQRGGELDTKTNDAIERAWKRWCRKDSCHTAGMHSFSTIERLLIRTIAESGEVLVRKITQRMGRSKVPFALELFEPDQLDETYNGVADDTGNEVRMGVELNAWKRPVAYHFLTQHPGDYQSNGYAKKERRIRVPADEILHLFIPERINQNRGCPWLVSAIIRLHHMAGMEEAELVTARATASMMGFIESPDGPPEGDEEGEEQEKLTEFAPGVFKYLAPGEKINVPNIARPGGSFDPFMRIMLRGVAAGIGTSYESLSRDYSQSNYSSSRLALLKDRDIWRALQAWIIENFHQPVFEKWLQLAVLSGEVSLKGAYDTNPELYEGVKWMPRGWSYVDPQKEVAAFKDAVRNGFMTQSEVIAQTGGNLEDTLDQRKRETELADKYGLTFDSNPASDPKQVAANAPAEDDETEADDEE
jgi:lambda family phage portal protein